MMTERAEDRLKLRRLYNSFADIDEIIRRDIERRLRYIAWNHAAFGAEFNLATRWHDR
jgi:hypothetical protein